MTKQEQSFLMAKRLKGLRNEKGLSCAELSAALLDKYGIKISRDSLMSYEIQTEHHSKIKDGKYPNLNMGVEYLNAFAQFYGVSTDFLLGLSDKPTIDPKAAEVAEYTGLSLAAIAELRKAKLDILKQTFTMPELNKLLCTDEFWKMVLDLSTFRQHCLVTETRPLMMEQAEKKGDTDAKRRYAKDYNFAVRDKDVLRYSIHKHIFRITEKIKRETKPNSGK